MVEWVKHRLDPAATLPSSLTTWNDKPSQESTHEVDPSQEWYREKRDGLPPIYEEGGKKFKVIDIMELDPLKIRFS